MRAAGRRAGDKIDAKLGIAPGQTTADGMFTLTEVECLGACDRAPVLMINDDGWHERLAPEQVGKFVDDLRARGYTALTGCRIHVEKDDVAYEPVLTNHVREPNAFTLDFYLKNARGYEEGLRKALTQQPNEIIEQVKASGLTAARDSRPA